MPATLVAGEVVLCSDIKGLGISLVYTPGTGSATGSFWFISAVASNKKIPPNTKLHLFREGKLQASSGEGQVPYDLTQPKKIMACVLQSSDRTDLSEPKALDAVINEMKINKITLYDDKDWTAGACPATLKGRQGYAFMPTSDEHRKLSRTRLRWGRPSSFGLSSSMARRQR